MNSSLDKSNTARQQHQVIKVTNTEPVVNKFLLFISAVVIGVSAYVFSGCAAANDESANVFGAPITSGVSNTCVMDQVRNPSGADDDFSSSNMLYGNRGFLSSYQGVLHLGHDIILPAGASINPIVCGKIVFYGPADGYGTLVVAIEHTLEQAIQVLNGDGDWVFVKAFLTIYGHGSKIDPMGKEPDLNWKIGDTVSPSDTIMYIQEDIQPGQTHDPNGHGPEHLHFGVRAQSVKEAKAVDGSYWLRGNDTNGKYKKYFTDPVTFLPALGKHLGVEVNKQGAVNDNTASGNVTHHPIGTLLLDKTNDKEWLVVEQDQILDVGSYKTLPRSCAVITSQEEIACYKKAAFHPLAMVLDAKVVKFDGLPEVYRLFPGPGYETTGYHVFLSYESFLSWGYRDSQIEHHPASAKQNVLGNLTHKGGVGFMSGSLVKGIGQSETAVANQHGTRRPIFHWDVFQQAGYKQQCVYEIHASTLDVVAGSRVESMITSATLLECSAGSSQSICAPGTVLPCSCNGSPGNQSCLDDGMSFGPCMCEPGPGGSGGSSGAGGTSGTAGTGGSDAEGGSGGSSGASGSSGTGGGSGTGGSAGSGGTANVGGSSGSAGTGGASTNLVSVTIVYQGPHWTKPTIEASWGTRPYGAVSGCTPLAFGYASCTFDVPEAVLNSMYWQVNLGNSRYWGDTSGVSPAPCVPAGDLPNYFGTEVTVIGTVSLKLDGVPKTFGLCSNGIMNPAYSNICGESPYPYMNGCFF